MTTNKYYSGPPSDHFDGKRFFNPGGEQPRGFLDLIRWKMGPGNIAWPSASADIPNTAIPEKRILDRRLVVTMIGHASMLIQIAGLNIVTDPVWSERTSPFAWAGPKRINPPGISFGDLPPIDIVLVTHNHYDHLDVATLKRLQEAFQPHFVTPLGNDAIIRAQVPKARITAMDWGDALRISADTTLHCEPCHHWSARGAGDRRMALWGAFVVDTPVGKVYHIGDTGFHDGINYCSVRQKHGDLRLANLPIGAYEPRWFMKSQHQNPEEAVQSMLLCGASYAAGHHWGTVKLTNEGMEQPVDALHEALDRNGIARERFRGMRPGDVFEVP